MEDAEFLYLIKKLAEKPRLLCKITLVSFPQLSHMGKLTCGPLSPYNRNNYLIVLSRLPNPKSSMKTGKHKRNLFWGLVCTNPACVLFLLTLTSWILDSDCPFGSTVITFSPLPHLKFDLFIDGRQSYVSTKLNALELPHLSKQISDVDIIAIIFRDEENKAQDS